MTAVDKEVQERLHRARIARKVIAALAGTGPRFLYSPADDRAGQLAVDRYGQTWYIDSFTGLMLYPFEGHEWNGFSAGPEQKAIVMALASYVRNHQPVDLALIEHACASAYAEAWADVRAQLVALEAIRT